MDRDENMSVASTNISKARRVAVTDDAAVQEGIRAGHINISSGNNTEMMTVGFSSQNQDTIQRNQGLQREYDLARQARGVNIPTSDLEIKSRLRELREPITLFNENVVERGERLRKAIATFMGKKGRMPTFTKPNQVESGPAKDEEFYTPGSEELKNARIAIAKYSIPLAAYRLDFTRRQRAEIDRLDDELKYADYIQNFGEYEMMASQYADTRWLSSGDLSADNQLFATAGWSGEGKVWGIPDSEYTFADCTDLKGHRDRINHIKFHPRATVDLDEDGPNIATASADAMVRVWTLNQNYKCQKSTVFSGHDERANSVEFHPLGSYIASSSHDLTWRLWDIETQKELWCQEGHAGPVYPLSFQNDGALLASGDLNGIANIWDLRTGKGLFSDVAHRKKCIAIKFLPNSYQFATGGDDNQIKIWDLRKKKWVQIVPAHFKLISSISFEQEEGKFMVSTSYDGKWKVWNTRDWSPVTVLSGYEAKVSSASFAKDNRFIITTSFDRSLKLWEKKKPKADQEHADPAEETEQQADVQMENQD